MRLAVGDTYVDADHPLEDGDEVSFLPPVSGGADLAGGNKRGSGAEKVQLREQPFPWGSAEATLATAGAGAVTTFRGIIRDHAEGRPVHRLRYEARTSMALKLMREKRAEALARGDITDVAIWHRLGTLEVGDLAVEIAVSSPHRQASFEVARAIIEAFKTDIPIYKHEDFADGSSAWKHEPEG